MGISEVLLGLGPLFSKPLGLDCWVLVGYNLRTPIASCPEKMIKLLCEKAKFAKKSVKGLTETGRRRVIDRVMVGVATELAQ